VRLSTARRRANLAGAMSQCRTGVGRRHSHTPHCKTWSRRGGRGSAKTNCVQVQVLKLLLKHRGSEIIKASRLRENIDTLTRARTAMPTTTSWGSEIIKAEKDYSAAGMEKAQHSTTSKCLPIQSRITVQLTRHSMAFWLYPGRLLRDKSSKATLRPCKIKTVL
jgi:hypothetical protein